MPASPTFPFTFLHPGLWSAIAVFLGSTLMVPAAAEDGGADNEFRVWLDVFTDHSEQQDDALVQGFEADTDGVTVGLEKSFGAVTLGASFTRLEGEVGSDRFGLDDQDTDEFALFGSYGWSRHALSMSVAYSTTQIRRIRAAQIPTLDGVRLFPVRSDPDSTQLSGALFWSTGFQPTELIGISLFLGLSYGEVEVSDFTELGSGPQDVALLFDVATATASQFVGRAGVSINRLFFAGDWLLAPNLGVDVEHDFESETASNVTRLRSTRLSFESRGFSNNKTRVGLSAGIHAQHLSGFGMALSYELQNAEDYDYNAVVLSLYKAF